MPFPSLWKRNGAATKPAVEQTQFQTAPPADDFLMVGSSEDDGELWATRASTKTQPALDWTTRRPTLDGSPLDRNLLDETSLTGYTSEERCGTHDVGDSSSNYSAPLIVDISADAEWGQFVASLQQDLPTATLPIPAPALDTHSSTNAPRTTPFVRPASAPLPILVPGTCTARVKPKSTQGKTPILLTETPARGNTSVLKPALHKPALEWDADAGNILHLAAVLTDEAFEALMDASARDVVVTTSDGVKFASYRSALAEASGVLR